MIRSTPVFFALWLSAVSLSALAWSPGDDGPDTGPDSIVLSPHSTGELNASILREDLSQALGEFDEALTKQTTDPDGARKLFRSSAARFEAIVRAGITNGRLEFNLANAHLQGGDLGRAILHYRRAQRLIPRDPLLMDNLSLARSRRLTTIGPTRSGTLMRRVFFWHYDLTELWRVRGAVGAYVCLWILLAVRSFAPRRALTTSAIIAMVIAVALATSVAVGRFQDRASPNGVVLAMDVAVLKGPGEGYQRRFEQPLQPGVEFTLRERRGNWWNIRLPDGQAGWIDALNAQLIPATGG